MTHLSLHWRTGIFISIHIYTLSTFNYSIVRSNFTLQAFGKSITDTGIDLVSDLGLLGESKISWCDSRDVAEVLAEIVTSKDDKHTTKTYTLTG